MTDKEQIMIDGVNILDCDNYYVEQETDQVKCDLSGEYCRENKNCFYKKLARKTQECDIWKNQVLVLDEESVTVQVTQEQFEEYQKLKQECEKLSILAQEESARNGYVEYELNDKLKQKTQECENLKVEEKYLKQCCAKAGEELAKHSFEYDGKEKNLVVQVMELNEKYEKLKKALEEIEEYTKNFSEVDLFNDIKDIIKKAKGERKCQ